MISLQPTLAIRSRVKSHSWARNILVPVFSFDYKLQRRRRPSCLSHCWLSRRPHSCRQVHSIWLYYYGPEMPAKATAELMPDNNKIHLPFVNNADVYKIRREVCYSKSSWYYAITFVHLWRLENKMVWIQSRQSDIVYKIWYLEENSSDSNFLILWFYIKRSRCHL